MACRGQPTPPDISAYKGGSGLGIQGAAVLELQEGALCEKGLLSKGATRGWL